MVRSYPCLRRGERRCGLELCHFLCSLPILNPTDNKINVITIVKEACPKKPVNDDKKTSLFLATWMQYDTKYNSDILIKTFAKIEALSIAKGFISLASHSPKTKNGNELSIPFVFSNNERLLLPTLK